MSRFGGRRYQLAPAITPPPSGSVDIGTLSVGPDSFPPSDGRVIISGPYAVVSDCTMASIFIREYATGFAGGDIYGVVFADNGSGLPTGSPLAIGAAVVATGVAGWRESVIAVPVALLASGPQIHVGYTTDGVYNAAFTHATGSGAMRRYEGWGGSGPLGALGDTYVSLLSAYVHCTIP